MIDKSERNGGMSSGKATTSHESSPSDATHRKTCTAGNAAGAATASNKRKLSNDDSPVTSDSDGARPSGLAKKKTRREAAAATKETGIEFPLIPLLNSQFFFGTSLTLVNREAYQHTKTLVQHANKIKRFLGKRCCPQMYYNMYGDYVHLRHGPATNEGPSVIDEASLDVFMVSISTADYHATDRGPTRHSLRALAESIQSWWQSVGRHRLTTHSPDAYYLPSGCLVDFSAGGNQFTPSLHLRGAVIRGYMKYNNLWRSAAPLFQTNYFSWWIVTTDEFDKYGWPEYGEVYLYIHHSEEGFRAFMAARAL